ncbi:MAG: WD40 repeat domain-containing protein [Saccharothrix sp.]|nr:WD40 repeat domain-containing protein [Saccharothrix sp.]
MAAPDEGDPRLDALFASAAVTTAEATGDVTLTDANQGYLAILKGLVDRGDRDRLVALVRARLVIHEILDANSSHQAAPPELGDPFHDDEGLIAHSGRALAALALALVDGPEHASAHVEVFQRWLEHSGLRGPGDVVHEVGREIGGAHREVYDHLAARGALDPLTLAWMLELDGTERAARPRTHAGPAVRVLTHRGTQGRIAELQLSYSRDLPPGLVPDPAMMTLTTANAEFQQALTDAWQLAGGERAHAVLWTLRDAAGPLHRVGGPSLGAALTVLLEEHSRTSRRFRGPLTLRRIQPGNAIVGAVDPTNPNAIVSVSGYKAKLSVVNDRIRVILPRADLPVAESANSDGAVQLAPVDTWPEAAKLARRWARRKVLTASVALVTVVALAVGTALAITASHREADQRRASSASLTAQAVNLRKTDPALAAKIALAAHRVDPANPSAVDALRDLMADRRNVERSWHADKSRVDAIGVSDSLGRVITSGAERTTKLWTKEGASLGELPRHSTRLVAARTQPLAVGLTPDGIVLFDIGGDGLREIAVLAKPSCAKRYTENVVEVAFTGQDSAVVTVWPDGSISTHDIVTRQEISCIGSDAALAPLELRSRLPVEMVIDADIVEQPRGRLEVVLLLTTNDVVTAHVSEQRAEITIPARQITGDASLVAASDDAIAVATKQGVAVWSTPDTTLIANPAGGLRTEPRTIEFSGGHLLLAGRDGTAVVRIGQTWWELPDSLGNLGGGDTTIAAIDGKSVVAGSPGGQVWVIGDTASGLQLDQDVLATDVAFLPDGRVVGSSAFSSDSMSRKLVVLDPAKPPAPASQRVPYPQYAVGTKEFRFYANEVAAVPGMAAAAGQEDGDGRVLVWRDDDRTTPRRLSIADADGPADKPLERIIASVGFTPAGDLLVAQHVTGKLAIWSTADWKPLTTIDLEPGDTRITVGRDYVLASGGTGDDAELVRIDLPLGTVAHRERVPGLDHLTASEDGTTVVTVTDDGLVQRRDAELKAVGEAWRPSMSAGTIRTAVSDPSGQRLAIGQGEKILVYALATHLLALPELRVEDGQVVNVTWSPDGSLLAGVSMPPKRGLKTVNPLRVWHVGDLDWTRQVCDWAGSGFTPDEWTRYAGEDTAYIDMCGEND